MSFMSQRAKVISFSGCICVTSEIQTLCMFLHVCQLHSQFTEAQTCLMPPALLFTYLLPAHKKHRADYVQFHLWKLSRSKTTTTAVR